MELSKCKGTIGKIINDNVKDIMACTTKNDLVVKMEDLLENSENKDKNNFLFNLKRCRSYTDAMSYVLNYLMKGDGFGSIR